MAFPRFFKIPKHQQYDYKPRYWDPRKEELEERLKRIQQIEEGNIEGVKNRISGGFKRRYQAENSSRKSQVMRSNLYLLGVIVVLGYVTYLLLTVYLPDIVKMLEN
jgi:hypothetical protein